MHSLMHMLCNAHTHVCVFAYNTCIGLSLTYVCLHAYVDVLNIAHSMYITAIC